MCELRHRRKIAAPGWGVPSREMVMSAMGPGLDDGKDPKELQAQVPGITTSTLMFWPTCPVP